MARRSAAESLKLRSMIFDLHAQRKSHTEIARTLKVTYNTVKNHVEAAYKEALAPIVANEAFRDLALIQQTLQKAVERYMTSGDPADAVPVRGFLQDRAKLLGLNAVEKLDVSVVQITQEDLAIIDLIQSEKARNAIALAELTDEQLSS